MAASWGEQLRRELAGRGLAVASVPGKGRGLVAARAFFPGEVIISQEPYVSTPNKISVGSSCDYCFTSTNLRKCSVCRVAWYCSSACQVLADSCLLCSDYVSVDCASSCFIGYALHGAPVSAERRVETASTRMSSDGSACRGQKEDAYTYNPFDGAPCSKKETATREGTDNYNLVDALESHISEVDEKQLVLYAQMANLVHLILPSFELDLKEIAHNFSKFACNAHTICDPELRPLGTGLYPVISIINHSCVPNAVLIFDGRTAYVRALQPIGKDEEVSISYIETAAVTKKRQNDLKQYFFTCTCPRCVKYSEEDTLLEGYRCKNQSCNGYLLPASGEKAYKCQKCSVSRDEEEIEKMRSEIATLSDKASSFLSSGSPIYKIIEQLERKLYHAYSVTLLHTRETLLKIYMELQDWQTALMYCRLTIPVYERVYPPFHPMIGLQFYTCGKLEWCCVRLSSRDHNRPFLCPVFDTSPSLLRLLECTEDALKSLTRAADILRITHGTNSQFMKELFGKLEEARAEVCFRLSSTDGHDEPIS
ncbi:hypothetical protein ACP4OV_001791 [Aristida adscensionis]